MLPVLPSNAGGGITELVAFEATPKLNADALAATGAAVEFDPAVKLKLLDLLTLPAGVEELTPELLLLLTVALPPNAKGLLVVGGTVAAEAPKENGADAGEVTLD